MTERERDNIIADANDVKENVANLARNKGLKLTISTSRNTLGDFSRVWSDRTLKKNPQPVIEEFDGKIDNYIEDKYVTAIKVEAFDRLNNKQIDRIINKYSETGIVVDSGEEKKAGKDFYKGSFAEQFLGLMGVDTAQVKDPQGALFGIALNLNNQKLEKKHEDEVREIRQDFERKETARKEAEANCKIKELTKELNEVKAKYEKLKKENDDLTEQSKSSIGNITLGGIGAQCFRQLLSSTSLGGGILSGIMNNPAVQEGLAQASMPNADANIEVQPEDERTPIIEQINVALRNLNDADFQDVCNSIMKFVEEAKHKNN